MMAVTAFQGGYKGACLLGNLAQRAPVTLIAGSREEQPVALDTLADLGADRLEIVLEAAARQADHSVTVDQPWLAVRWHLSQSIDGRLRQEEPPGDAACLLVSDRCDRIDKAAQRLCRGPAIRL